MKRFDQDDAPAPNSLPNFRGGCPIASFSGPRRLLDKEWLKPRISEMVRRVALVLLFFFTMLSFREYPSDAFIIPAGWALGISVLMHIARVHQTRRFGDIVLSVLAPAAAVMAGVMAGSAMI